MSEIVFIEKNPEAVLSDTIALYQQKAGVVLNNADPERILIDCMGYREVLLRNQMEWLMRQNFVQLAVGLSLDNWGQLFGVVRLINESDDEYRTRILAFNKSEGIGTKAAYKARILSLTGVADVLLYSKNDDNSLLPGRVRIVPIQKIIDADQIEFGIEHNSDLESAILAAISTDEFGVVGNIFNFQTAVPVLVNGVISVRKLNGFDDEIFLSNIEFQLNRYFGQLSLNFGLEFGITQLNSYLVNTAGLQQVVSLTFTDVPVLTEGEFYQRGVISLNIE
jgi:hypothetical protein